ncbi:MAG TPA: hypothetical protein VK435_12140 [Thermodesulfovibrionales bacterium]|nr:hypothetical protein [Thermodesulfovibrionales bacterium]
MKRWTGAITLACCLVLLAVPMFAQAGMGMSATGKVVALTFTGEVTSVDPQAQTITAKRGETVFTAVVDSNTVIKKEKEEKQLSDIKAGNIVVIRYFEERGANAAKLIMINPNEKK